MSLTRGPAVASGSGSLSTRARFSNGASAAGGVSALRFLLLFGAAAGSAVTRGGNTRRDSSASTNCTK